jgi:DNA-directed RNA polymerase subunit beta'
MKSVSRRAAALDLFKPFVVQEALQMGAGRIRTRRSMRRRACALRQVEPRRWRALDKVMAERPVLLKRDPALHKYSVQAFRARAGAGSAIQIHPLVTAATTPTSTATR